MLGALLGNYRVIDTLGEGGMGVVYVGRHETLGRRVVVKVLRPDMSRKSDMVKRFFNEAQAATAINNPGIAQVFDFGTTPEGQAYFVMELLEGETLAARLRHGPLDARECCRIGRQIANVLQATHDAGITHRDLKPDNLFLVPDAEVIGGERVKVLDFGLAKLANEARPINTRAGLVMGTPSYMSPEQCRGIRNADARSDIYSLGCVLFKMACGRAPFVGEGLGDVIIAHVEEPAPDPRELAPQIPAGLSALITKMLAKHPGSRPQTMAAVSQAFDEILSTLSGPVARTPPPPLVPAPPVLPSPAPEDPPSLTLADPIPTTPSDTLPAPPMPPPDHSDTTPEALPAAALPEPQPLPTAAVVAGAERSSVPSLRPGRLPFVLAGFLVAGAAITLAIVLAAGGSGSPERPISGGAIEAVGSAQARMADALEAECRVHQTERKWTKLERCADQLKPLDPDRGTALKLLAEQETKSASRIAAVEAALRNDNLKRAKSELEDVWPESVEHTDIKRKYALAEAQATGDLAAELARVKDSDCKKYNRLLEKERTRKPVRVLEEAARRTPCSPLPRCDADALAHQGQGQLAAGQDVEAFMSYEAAYACNPTPARARAAFTVSCNLRNVARARSYWKQMAPAIRGQAVDACVRNGITAATLNAP